MAWHQMGKKKYILIWAITFLLMVVQRLFNILKDDFPSFESYWMVVVLLSMVTVVGGSWGHMLRTKSKIKIEWLVAIMVMVYVATFYFTMISPHVGLQMSLYVIFNSLLLVIVGVIIYKHRECPLPAEIGTSVTYILFSMFQFASAVFAFMQGDNYDPIYRDIYTYLNFVTMPAAFTAMGLFTVFMVASDLSEEMKAFARTDPLTGALNRRGFCELANKAVNNRRNQSLCLVYWDIDHFKSINDNYGHAAGDSVLIQSVANVREKIKNTDLIGRFGGEEFVMLLDNDDKSQAVELAEQLCKNLEALELTHNERPIRVTASFGIAHLELQQNNLEQAIDAADKALYRAKQLGRNQVVVA